MRKFVLILLLVTLAAPALAAPVIFVEKPAFDFGTIVQGQKLEHHFILRNRGDEPLLVRGLRSSCGCTAATSSTRSIAPGKSGEVTVVFDSSSFFGTVTKTVMIDSNDPRSPTLDLILKGVIREVISCSPRTLNLGVLKAGTKKVAVVTLENHGHKSFAVLKVDSPITGIVGTAPGGTVAPGKTGEVVVTVVVPREGRFISGYLTIHTDNPQKSELVVPVYATISQ